MIKNFNIRMEEADKKEFTDICKNIGISASTAFNIFVKAVIREKEIPFKLSSKKINNNFFNETNIQCLEKLKNLDDNKKLKFISKDIDELLGMEK